MDVAALLGVALSEDRQREFAELRRVENEHSEELDAMGFHVHGRTRLRAWPVIEAYREGELTVREISEKYRLSLMSTNRVLRRYRAWAGVGERRRGRKRQPSRAGDELRYLGLEASP